MRSEDLIRSSGSTGRFCYKQFLCTPLCSAHKNLHKNFGFPELRSYRVKELGSSDLHILNGVHSSLVTMVKLVEQQRAVIGFPVV